MSWTLLLGVVVVLGLALFTVLFRRAELRRMGRLVAKRERAVRQGAKAQLQHPVIDLSRCLGCGTCVASCPEEGVLDLVHGQAQVVNGARCVGVSACERECPVGAITVTLDALEERNDVPVLTDGLEAVGSPGLFLAGEVTVHALIKTAIDHGVAVASEVASRVRNAASPRTDVLDLCIVGAGPAGLACSLEAKRQGLRFSTLDQETVLGGTVAKYPRRKLVVTSTVELPLYGRLEGSSFTKEELVELWQRIAAEEELPIQGGEVFEGLARDEDGNYVVRTAERAYVARHVCLAVGRRGSPRKLGVPGEELTKVAYSLLDAHSYQQRRILVVGGGDSAVETALGLAGQPGNEVTLSYRRGGFFRIRAENERRLAERLAAGRLRVIFESHVRAIRPESVELEVKTGTGPEAMVLPNDEVFVMAGGKAPVEVLAQSGVSFDSSLRPKADPLVEQGTGLTRALALGFAVALVTLAWAAWNADYYLLERAERPADPKHALLRPSQGVGLWMGISAAALIVVNLLYLLRRSPRVRFQLGSLQLWMTSHVATGIGALLCAMLHGAMAPRDTVGGHAFWALAALLLTGAIGRYFYAYVPRAANGRELELEEVKLLLARMADRQGGGQGAFHDRAWREVSALIEARQWRSSFPGRVLALFGGQRELARLLDRLADHGRDEGIPEDQVQETLQLARKAHRTSLMAAHFEDLRAVLGTWRYLHRWVAALMVLLTVVHVVYALVYTEATFGAVR